MRFEHMWPIFEPQQKHRVSIITDKKITDSPLHFSGYGNSIEEALLEVGYDVNNARFEASQIMDYPDGTAGKISLPEPNSMLRNIEILPTLARMIFEAEIDNMMRRAKAALECPVTVQSTNSVTSCGQHFYEARCRSFKCQGAGPDEWTARQNCIEKAIIMKQAATGALNFWAQNFNSFLNDRRKAGQANNNKELS